MLDKFKRFFLLIGDIVFLYIALWLTLLLRYQVVPSPERWNQHFLPFSGVFIIWLIVFYIGGLYNLQIARNNVKFFSTLFKTFLWSAALALAFFYLNPAIDISPKTNLVIVLGLSFVLLAAWRQIYNHSVKADTLRNNVLVIGWNDQVAEVAKIIVQAPQLGFRLIGVLENEPSLKKGSEQFRNLQFFDFSTNLTTLVLDKNIKTIVSSLSPHKHPELARRLYGLLYHRVNIIDLTNFYEKILRKIPVQQIEQMWFLENLQEAEKSFYDKASRVTDIVFSLLLGLIALPLTPLVWLAVKLDSAGTSFFMQYRVGQNGKEFLAIKFRTMIHDAESKGPQWAMVNDPRVTRVGKILRKTRIDEIPQLVNVLKGEMSFVGPRPERPEFVEKLQHGIPFYSERHLVKPGLTGWAQVNFPYGSSEEDAFKKLQYDLYYIKNRSLMLDLSILLKTIKIILSGVGR